MKRNRSAASLALAVVAVVGCAASFWAAASAVVAMAPVGLSHGAVVATQVGGNPELVEEGVTGRLVPRREVGALAGGIDAYVEDAHLRALHGKAGRQRVADLFDLDRMTAAYVGLYTGLLTKRSGRGA